MYTLVRAQGLRSHLADVSRDSIDIPLGNRVAVLLCTYPGFPCRERLHRCFDSGPRAVSSPNPNSKETTSSVTHLLDEHMSLSRQGDWHMILRKGEVQIGNSGLKVSSNTEYCDGGCEFALVDLTPELAALASVYEIFGPATGRQAEARPSRLARGGRNPLPVRLSVGIPRSVHRVARLSAVSRNVYTKLPESV